MWLLLSQILNLNWFFWACFCLNFSQYPPFFSQICCFPSLPAPGGALLPLVIPVLHFCFLFLQLFPFSSSPYGRTTTSFCPYFQDKLLPLLSDAWEFFVLLASIAWCCSVPELEGMIAGRIPYNPCIPGRTLCVLQSSGGLWAPLFYFILFFPRILRKWWSLIWLYWW